MNPHNPSPPARLATLREKVKRLSDEELAALARLLKRQRGHTAEELRIVAEQIAVNQVQAVRARHQADPAHHHV